MNPITHILGPRDAGPGERQSMLGRARGLLGDVAEIVRVDVPGRPGGEEDEPGRSFMESLVPALQTASLFGGLRGVELVDAENLLRSEAEILASLLSALDPESVRVVLVSSGALPPPLSRTDREVVEVKKIRERDAAQWLAAELRERRMKVPAEAVEGLLQRFGSDVAGLSRALEQLSSMEGPITRDTVLSHFRNRPDEPMWHYVDAVAAGDTGQALRRLSDFLTHGHPLQLLAIIEGDLRRRALASSAPDLDTLAAWVGSSPQHFTVQKAWRQRSGASDSELRKALDAVARADAALKSAAEETHRLTLERLTVALCRWLGGVARRAQAAPRRAGS